MKTLIAAICGQAGIEYTGHRLVTGGDINETYQVSGRHSEYFLKLNDAAAYPAMFTKEKRGLQALAGKSSLLVPAVIAEGEWDKHQFLLLEWLERGAVTGGFWEQFANGLASLHQNTDHEFGWNESNYIGSLVQTNKRHQVWAAFYAEERIIPLVKILFDSGTISKQDVANSESLCQKLVNIFPAENPALLHGDLWSGNFMAAANGAAAIYDPAVYFGHREMDIGMSKLFGGFPNGFYLHYHDLFPLEKDWQQRLPLSQLYPLLVHAVLFGGGYSNRCSSIIAAWC